MPTSSSASSAKPGTANVEAVAAKQRKIQQEVDWLDQDKRRAKAPKDMKPGQTGLKKQPAPPLSSPHLSKPGLESEITQRPQFLAEGYLGSGKLEGMTALITGGDSGIGRAVAVLYAREGADVAIAYLNEHTDADETRRHVENEGRRCITISGDVKDPQFCRDAVAQVVDAFGKLDILVNNAAFQEHAMSLEDITEEHFDETIKTNLYGYFHMAKAALPHLHAGSSIINTGSETGILGSETLLDYSATKGAIHAFTKSLASNVLPRGIRVNAVAPGPVWTPLNPADAPADKVKEFGKKTPMQRPAQPEELSPAYVFLASPVCASYVTGIVLPVMGGTINGA